MKGKELFGVVVLAWLLGFAAGGVYQKFIEPEQLRPVDALRSLVDDAPIYSLSFFISNRYGVIYAVHVSAIRTNTPSK